MLARSLCRGGYEALSSDWADRVTDAAKICAAEQLYCGRAVTETLQAAGALNAEVAFLSAGLGVVPRHASVPAYSLTSSPGMPDSIGARLTEAYTPQRWWKALLKARRQGRALAHLIDDLAPSLILVVLPASYLQMVHEDLETLPTSVQRRFRILGPRKATDVPTALSRYWLPYDARLDNAQSGFNGTTGDFPHRALRHFSTCIAPARRSSSFDQHRQAVELFLKRFTPYVRQQGVPASDDEVLKEIRQLWNICGGNRSRMLRELRTNRGIACEQSRFRGLIDRFEEMA